MYVDSEHSVDKSNCRSRTGFFIYMNSALVMWQQEKRPFLVLNFGDEGWNQDSAGTTLQAVHEGYCNLRTN